MPNANIVDHIGGKVTVWTKDGNAAENRMLHTVDEFGVVISNQHGKQTFIPWGQVRYIDYPDSSPESVAVKWDQSMQPTPAIKSNDERPWLLQVVSTKALSDELRIRSGVQTYQLSPGELMSIEQGGGIRTLSGPAIVLINQD